MRMLELARIGGVRFYNEALRAKYSEVKDLVVATYFAFRGKGGFCGWILSS